MASGAFVKAEWQYKRIEGASHWLQLDEPDQVNKLLIDFFAKG
jgi:pimeloyl-ACP methyl ester carboxylesterase